MVFELIDEYHWTEEQIQNTSYKQIQEIFLLKRIKGDAVQQKVQIDRFKQEHAGRTQSSGQSKRFTRQL